MNYNYTSVWFPNYKFWKMISNSLNVLLKLMYKDDRYHLDTNMYLNISHIQAQYHVKKITENIISTKIFEYISLHIKNICLHLVNYKTYSYKAQTLLQQHPHDNTRAAVILLPWSITCRSPLINLFPAYPTCMQRQLVTLFTSWKLPIWN